MSHLDFVSQKEIFEVAKDHGWWEGEQNIPEKLMLIVSELGEALEHYRERGVGFFRDETGKPDGFGIELADAVIRIRDLSEYLHLDLEQLISVKHEYNKTRPYRHGNKAC